MSTLARITQGRLVPAGSGSGVTQIIEGVIALELLEDPDIILEDDLSIVIPDDEGIEIELEEDITIEVE